MYGVIQTQGEMIWKSNANIFWIRNRMVRQEEEFEISAEDFEKLVQKRIGNGVYKVRYYLPLDEAHTAEIDIYEQQMEGLMVVEVEFENEADAERFEAPEWFGREVTDDPAYTNAMLAFGSWKKE